MKYEVINPELLDLIESQDRYHQAEWLFLEPSEEFKGCWEVWALWPEWFIELEDTVGAYRLVTPASLQEFADVATDLGYKICFVEDPFDLLEGYGALRNEPPFNLQSELENTVNGFLPWQVVGYNKLIKEESLRAGYVVWDTGAGKTAFIAAAIRYHQEFGHGFNLALVVVKSHNKIDTQRKLLRLAGIESVVIDGPVNKRYDIYEQIELDLVACKQVVAITNYEKFREDHGVFKFTFKRRDCLFFWDEAPTKLSNRNTQLYKSVKKSLYESFYSKPRPSWMRHFILTATPIENSPNDVYSVVNLCWPGLLGNVTEFYAEHAMMYIDPDNPKNRRILGWRNLDRLEAKLSFMIHRVSKKDPEVAEMFPEVIPIPTPIDWDPKHRLVYDKLTGKAIDMIEDLEDANILAIIQIMQMMCDSPSMIRESAANREEFIRLLNQSLEEGTKLSTKGPKGSEVASMLVDSINTKHLVDTGHTKQDMLHEIICEKHPDAKIVIFSTWANYIYGTLIGLMARWGVTCAVYAGTDKQKQEALDQFRNDPDIRVFITGDAGSDSIDISEASVVIHYNIPWKWTRLKQRVGRIDRVNSTFNTVYEYTLAMVDSIDERKLEICERKYNYHAAVFEGRALDEAASTAWTREDLMYILTGNPDLMTAEAGM